MENWRDEALDRILRCSANVVPYWQTVQFKALVREELENAYKRGRRDYCIELHEGCLLAKQDNAYHETIFLSGAKAE